jgi:hypothetical protein
MKAIDKARPTGTFEIVQEVAYLFVGAGGLHIYVDSGERVDDAMSLVLKRDNFQTGSLRDIMQPFEWIKR